MFVYLRRVSSGEVRRLKVGWSWTLFLFTFFIAGLPFALRGVWTWAMYVVALNILLVVSSIAFYAEYALSLDWRGGTWIPDAIVVPLVLGLSIFFGMRGNALTGRYLLGSGWVFLRPESEESEHARVRWGLNDGSRGAATSQEEKGEGEL